MKLTEFIADLMDEVDHGLPDLEVRFQATGRFDLEYMGVYEANGMINIDVGHPGE